MLPPPSDEQQEIINCFIQGYNVKVDSVAGSGKSTTLLMLALRARDDFNAKTLVITYNRDLKDELKEKITNNNLDGYCKAYTYHGYASKIYQATINNDILLNNYLAYEPKTPNKYNIILLDEVQDMNSYYHKLITKIVGYGDMLVLVGDKNQCINEYLQASPDYLINYDKYFDTGRPWKVLALRTSYRLTPSITKFVNTHILKEQRIISGNIIDCNIKPTYQYGVWSMDSLIKKNVKKYGPNDVIIIVPSIKCTKHPKSPIGKLLSRKHNKLLFFVRDNDVAGPQHECSHNKVIISTYNAMKGRERKCVIVYGFDESYFEFYDKKWSAENPLLPNIMYVAATRARESLIIIQDTKKPPLRTIDINTLKDHTEIIGDQKDIEPSKNKQNKENPTNITDAIKHRNLSDIIELLSLITIEIINPSDNILHYNNVIQFNGYYEDMRKYYGSLIPLYAEYKLNDGNTHLKPINTVDIKTMTDICDKYNHLLLKKNKDIKEWMELVVTLTAMNNKYHFSYDQILNYDWVDENFILTATNRLLSIIPPGGSFEYVCKSSQISEDIFQMSEDSFQMSEDSYSLVGNLDYIIDNDITNKVNKDTINSDTAVNSCIWEFKCTSSLFDDHKIQCGAYIALYYLQSGKLLPCYLFNIRTQELLKITINNPHKLLQILSRK